MTDSRAPAAAALSLAAVFGLTGCNTNPYAPSSYGVPSLGSVMNTAVIATVGATINAVVPSALPHGYSYYNGPYDRMPRGCRETQAELLDQSGRSYVETRTICPTSP